MLYFMAHNSKVNYTILIEEFSHALPLMFPRTPPMDVITLRDGRKNRQNEWVNSGLTSSQHIVIQRQDTVELYWLEHLWDHENVFETGVVHAIEGLI